eukprot:6177192-Pleurochrysis_carterae.AAC.2
MRILLCGFKPAIVNLGASFAPVARLGRHEGEVAPRRRGQADVAEAGGEQVVRQLRLVVCVLVQVGLGRADEREEQRVGAQLAEALCREIHFGDP